MKKKTLTERVAELERELEELKAAPRTEQHIHHHYPYRVFRQWPYPNYYPQHYYPSWWSTAPAGQQTVGISPWSGTVNHQVARWTINNTANPA